MATAAPRNPAARYPTPEGLIADAALSLEEKCELLDEWEDDVRHRLVASEEGMSGAPVQVELVDVLAAKAKLPIDTRPRPTDTKA
ncbi:MAG: hypothetical protein JNL81_03020 [Hyphomonadaceae bacterium]|nr:hypothetical protein [Hyphomonadaceae bacterium]